MSVSVLEKDFQFEPVDEISFVSDSVELRCDPPVGDPSPTVTWLKDGENIGQEMRFRISNDYSLLILLVRPEDSGEYSCVASNLADSRRSKPAMLTVLGKKSLQPTLATQIMIKCFGLRRGPQTRMVLVVDVVHMQHNMWRRNNDTYSHLPRIEDE
jgi:hypothetical protein